MRSGIQEQTLQTMLEGSAAREVLGSRYHDKWGWPIRLGEPYHRGFKPVDRWHRSSWEIFPATR